VAQPAAPPPEPRRVPAPPLAAQPKGDFDLAAELSLGIGADDVVMRTLAGTEEEGFEQVFNAFKSGVDRELEQGDHEARYDLGIAYKEMGLLEDAIGEFRLAMEAEARRLSCLHMMGLCALELGRAADAVGHVEQALSLPDLPDDQRVALRYDLGRAYAASGDVARARAAFEAVRAADPGFGEVERELAALAVRTSAAAPAPAEVAETFESFDDLLGAEEGEAPPQYESFEDLFTDGDDDEAPPELESDPEPSRDAEPVVLGAARSAPAEAPAPPSRRTEARPEPAAAAPPPDVPAEPAAAPPPARKRRKISFF
jgi:tetratricopeptide (TPR) repeat protein